MGRSRGGLTTKIHALVDADGLPIALKLTEGQAHDGRAAWDMLGSLAAGNILLADRAYDCDALRRFGIGLTLAQVPRSARVRRKASESFESSGNRRLGSMLVRLGFTVEAGARCEQG
jgi:hypothetical protein